MLRGLTARQFMEWRAYADLEPFDEERADLRAASIVQAIFNSPRRKKDRLKLKDCLLAFGDDAEPIPPEKTRAGIEQALDLCMLIFNQPEPKAGK